MANNFGIFAGVARGRGDVRRYTPELRAFGGASPVSPILGSSLAEGRYIRRASGEVRCWGQIQFDATATFGSGEWIWGLRLPYPANRSNGGADLPIGTGFAWQGSVSNLNLPVVATLMDPNTPDGASSQEDYWAQFFLSWNIASGTGTVTSGPTAATITHGLGSTPVASDITITPTNAPSSNPGVIYVTNIGATTFDVTCRNSPGATGQNFAWKAMAFPNGSTTLDLLMNHQRPWTWASGHVLSWALSYEGRK